MQQMRTEDQKYLTLLYYLCLGETTRVDCDYLYTQIICLEKAVESLKEKHGVMHMFQSFAISYEPK
jgi:hypothetical protein